MLARRRFGSWELESWEFFRSPIEDCRRPAPSTAGRQNRLRPQRRSQSIQGSGCSRDDRTIPSRRSWPTRGFPVRTPRSPRTPASDSRRRRVDPVARDSAHPAASEPSVSSTPSGPHGVERRASAIGSPRVPAGRPAGVPRWSATPVQIRHSSSLESRLRRSRARRATNSQPGRAARQEEAGDPGRSSIRGCKAGAAGRACSSR